MLVAGGLERDVNCCGLCSQFRKKNGRIAGELHGESRQLLASLAIGPLA
jgi:hypothetical protein